MKVCAAQIKPFKGDIEKNIKAHLLFVDQAIEHQADAIFFPELSLTGYEPTLAKNLAINPNDNRLDIFQKKSNQHQITIGVGIPTIEENQIKPYISMVIFQPNVPRKIYSKQYLHVDELPYFIEGKNPLIFNLSGKKVIPAICFESLLPEHIEQSFEQGEIIYLASVAKDLKNIKKAHKHFPKIAKQYCMTVMMVNAIGESDNFECQGCSAVWYEAGRLRGHLEVHKEALLIYDMNLKASETLKITSDI